MVLQNEPIKKICGKRKIFKNSLKKKMKIFINPKKVQNIDVPPLHLEGRVPLPRQLHFRPWRA
jgi:hypothetical protein